MNFLLSTFLPLPGSTTRPELNVDKSSDALLKAAEDSYNQVLQPPQNEDHQSVVSARFNLGYIAENRGQWDKARTAFQQIIDDPAAGKEAQELAKVRLENVTGLAKPVLLAATKPSAPDMAMPPSLTGPLGGLNPSLLPSQQPYANPLPPATMATTMATSVPSIVAPASQPSVPLVPMTMPATMPALVPASLPMTIPASLPSTGPTSESSH